MFQTFLTTFYTLKTYLLLRNVMGYDKMEEATVMDHFLSLWGNTPGTLSL